MKTLIAKSIIGSLLIAQIVVNPVWATNSDYMSQTYTAHSCELFAKDAYQAADNFSRGVVLPDVLKFIETAPVSENEKERAFQAIQFVWKNQLDNPVMAYTLAMGLCMKPSNVMAPMDEPWLVSPRASRENI